MATSMIGPGSAASQVSLDQVRQTQLLSQINSLNGASQGGPAEDAKIQKGAQQFEAMLLSTWLQQAERSFATVPGAEDDEDAANRDQMLGLGVQSLAQSLAASGGIGIARMMSKALHAVAEKAEKQASGAPEAENKGGI